MMLANPTAGDTEAMRRVGDAMLSRDGAGVVAAHCCYLLSEQPLDAAPPAEAGRRGCSWLATTPPRARRPPGRSRRPRSTPPTAAATRTRRR